MSGFRPGPRALRLGCSLLLLGSSGCATLQWVPLPDGAEPHRVKTADGWEVALVRYRPQGPATGRPVVLVHGISANARNMDLDEGHSMARWFASQGREAWTVSLRGCGDSDRASGEARPGTYGFDAFWKLDLPAVIDEVKKVTGADAVDYVGHSMGGMIVYAYLSQGGTGIHAAATLGSPTRHNWGTAGAGLLQSAVKLLPAGWSVWSSTGAHLVVPFEGLIDDGPLERLFYVSGNTSLQSWKRLLAYGTADIAGPVAAQLVAAFGSGRFLSSDGALDFRKDLAKVTTPVIVVAARLDRIAPTPAVYDAYRALGGPRQWLLISRAHGAVAEYGHMDLVVGDRASTEVWTPVLQFFNRHEPSKER